MSCLCIACFYLAVTMRLEEEQKKKEENGTWNMKQSAVQMGKEKT